MNLKKPFRLLMSLLLPALAMSGCGESDTPMPEQPERAPMAYVSLSIAVADVDGMSRYTLDDLAKNYFENAASAYEKIHSMRFIIVDGHGNVEHNVLVNEDDVEKTRDHLFKVKPKDTKKIYLIGNEGSIPKGIMDNYVNLRKGDEFPTDYSSLVALSTQSGGPLFAGQQYIPMTEVHEFKIGEPKYDSDGINQVPYEATLFVTRASIKATFNLVVADTYYEFTPDMLSTISFNEIADKEFLFPNNTHYEPIKSDLSVDSRIITQYSVPDDAVTKPYKFKWIKMNDKNQRKFNTSTLYLPETAYGEKYSITLPVNGVDLTADLPNLTSLPRNTHVVVNITLNGASLNCIVTVVPYTGVDLNPEFGINRP